VAEILDHELDSSQMRVEDFLPEMVQIPFSNSLLKVFFNPTLIFRKSTRSLTTTCAPSPRTGSLCHLVRSNNFRNG
jgi:hypothetical protein